MITRILSALVLGPLVIAAAWIGGIPWWFLVTVAALLAVHEALGIVRSGGRRPDALVSYLLTVWLLASTGAAWSGWMRAVGAREASGLAAGIAVCVAAAYAFQFARPRTDRSTEDWAVTLAIPLHIALLCSFAVALRDRPDGTAWVLALLLLIWINDSAAYLGGRTFGRRPMVPTISPKKTWEGFWIALVTTVLAALSVPLVLSTVQSTVGLPLSPLELAALGAGISAVGPAGDLAVSVLKRNAGVKDSGHLIPGHGGMLDRIDSLMFAAPLVWLAAVWLGA